MRPRAEGIVDAPTIVGARRGRTSYAWSWLTRSAAFSGHTRTTIIIVSGTSDSSPMMDQTKGSYLDFLASQRSFGPSQDFSLACLDARTYIEPLFYFNFGEAF